MRMAKAELMRVLSKEGSGPSKIQENAITAASRKCQSSFEIKRVLECGNCGKLNIGGRLVFASAMDNGRQDFVRSLTQDGGVLIILLEKNCFQRAGMNRQLIRK